MRTFGVREAKAQFSRLIAAVEAGEEVVINRSGKAVARLAPVAQPARQLGPLAGRYTVPDDWDAPLPEEAFSALSLAQQGEPAPSPVPARRSALPTISIRHASKGGTLDNAGLFDLLDEADPHQPDKAQRASARGVIDQDPSRPDE